MDHFSGKSSSDIEGEQVDVEEKPLPSHDVVPNTSDVNGRNSSTSSSTSSLANCSPNEETGDNGDLLVDNVDSAECDIASPRKLPTVNTPEKIIFCLDICEDAETTPFKIVSGATFKPLFMVKRVIQMFMHNKQLLNKNHEFALVVLQADNVLWLRNFTKDPREVTSVIEDLCEINSEPGEFFNMSDLFDEVHRHVKLPAFEFPNVTNPAYTVRLILLYGRSNCVPEFVPGDERARDLLASEFFTVDVVYVHEDVSEQNRCEEIFGRLSELDEKGYSYMFHVARDTTKLHNSMAKLLAHPLQRPLQRRACYVLPEPQGDCD